MRFRKTLTFLILATGLVFALSAWAQPKTVAPTLRSARADVAASLPRHGGVKPPLRQRRAQQRWAGPNAVRPYVACAVVQAPHALPGVPHGECGSRGRQAVPLRLAQLVHERKVIDAAKDPQ